MIVVRFGRRRTDRRPRMVQELILEPHGHVGDCISVGLTKVGPGSKKRGELALADLIGMVAKLEEE